MPKCPGGREKLLLFYIVLQIDPAKRSISVEIFERAQDLKYCKYVHNCVCKRSGILLSPSLIIRWDENSYTVGETPDVGATAGVKHRQ